MLLRRTSGAEVKEKHIVICADDFGLNSEIDAAVLQLAQQRRLSATSCLVQGPSFASGAQAVRASGLQLGLHLNFTESLGNPGLYLPVSTLIIRSWLGQLDARQLREQIARQLDRFEALVGSPPDFVDGHQHVHQFPQIRRLLLDELHARYAGALPWLRCTHAGRSAGMSARLRVKAHLIQALGSTAFAKRARGMGFPMNRSFLGVYDFQGGQAAYRRLLQNWLMQARDGDLIMCHPAGHALAQDSLGAQRLAEFDVLRSNAMGDWLQEYRLTLV